ncbi:hypothetical protein [Streptomyces sp. ISL-100]|uniref:hypothetical protein n=1 Tax=Streptomyces sp. ISL-100 TaxID=2819173 RepID=UPI001BE7F0ED|nr:hypothetical protein [Streptomyces sp. ISL-100]MBT2397552.1 hypothetical protein [Streptomyces sp. ISL-100]
MPLARGAAVCPDPALTLNEVTLLDLAENQRSQPADNFVHRLASLLDEHITGVLDQRLATHTDGKVTEIAEDVCRTTIGRAVVPLLNAASRTTANTGAASRRSRTKSPTSGAFCANARQPDQWARSTP